MDVSPKYRDYINWRNKPSFYQEPLPAKQPELNKFWDVDHANQMFLQENLKTQHKKSYSTSKSNV